MNKEIGQLRLLISDLAASNRELRTRLEVMERAMLEMGMCLARLNAMHADVEAPEADHHERKPVLQ
jgi:hypothetical protein